MRLAVIAVILALAPAAQAVSRDEWIAWMRGAVPAFFCHPNHLYRRCAGVSELECRWNASAALERCLAKGDLTIPSQIQTYADDLKIQEAVGGCAARGYLDREFIRPRVSRAPECRVAAVSAYSSPR